MIDLTTKYLGLTLKNPLIVGSSELTNSAEKIQKLAAAGAGAVILKSLFEEQILMDIDAERVNNISGSYEHVENYLGFYLKKHQIDSYLKLIRDAKASVDIPVITSINCVSAGEWITYAKQIEEAGADALEVNMFIMPSDLKSTTADIEAIYFGVAEQITKAIKIPVAIKLSTYFTAMAAFLLKLSQTGISGMTFFNKFYSPAIDIDKEAIISQPIFSNPSDHGQSLRWIGLLSGHVSCDLSASTGVHSGKELISSLLVGAASVQMVSAIYQHGESVIGQSLETLKEWMLSKGYSAIEDFKGKLAQTNLKNPMIYERSQFMKYFSDSGR